MDLRGRAEIGSGFSTLIARDAIGRNILDDSAYRCEHRCIEPYEQPWLESLGVDVVRKRVECVELREFGDLTANDILFIDSSHVIRPQGDVLFEILELLPTLNRGVLVHIHDIFTPHDYPESWVTGEARLWNEQYLLEAFLCLNNSFETIGALNYLARNHAGKLAVKCPVFGAERETCEPSSYWIRKIH